MNNQKFDIPDGSQAYIVANLPEGEKDAIVVYKGNVRKLITLYVFAGAKIAERLQQEGMTDLQIWDAMIGTFTTAIDEVVKVKNRRPKKGGKGSQKYVNSRRIPGGN